MKRRGFLGALGAAIASGPRAAKSIGEMSMADLSLGRAGVRAVGGTMGSVELGEGRAGWAAKALAKLMGKSKEQEDFDRRRFWIDGLDAEIATLRSVSLHTKIQMTKTIAHRKGVREQKTYYQAIIDGWIED